MPFLLLIAGAAALTAGSSIAKSAAHSWAKSNLAAKRADIQASIDALECEKENAAQRIQNQKENYAQKIREYQNKCNQELQEYIAFLNQLLGGVVQHYIPRLEHFQQLMFSCIHSWMQVDMLQRRINTISQTIDAIDATMALYEAYIDELKKLSQRQSRMEWRHLMENRSLTVSGELIEKISTNIEEDSHSGNDKFRREIHRLKSEKEKLWYERGRLLSEHQSRMEEKTHLFNQHKQNQLMLKEEYTRCIQTLQYMKKSIWNYYSVYPTGNQYADVWLARIANTLSSREMEGVRLSIIRVKRELITNSVADVKECKEQFQYYRRRIKKAHDTGDYSTLDEDKEKRGEWYERLADAVEHQKIAFEAQTIIDPLLDEANEMAIEANEMAMHIRNLFKLHPDRSIEKLRELFPDKGVSTWNLLGISTAKEKREHDLGIQNDTRN